MSRAWVALNGFAVIEIGKGRNGKPRSALCTELLVVHSESDMKALAKLHPGTEWREVDGSWLKKPRARKVKR
jgi:hypothetical protein